MTTEAALVPLDELPINYKTLQTLISTPTVPKRYRDSKTGVNDMYAATLMGRELGIGSFSAIHEIYMVKGSASMSGRLMLALVWRAGHKVNIEIGETGSKVNCFRKIDGVWELVGFTTFDIEDAVRADLMDKGTYQSYPKTMLTWRAVSMACRLYYPDVILGVGYVPEEVGVDDAPVDAIPDYALDTKGELVSENAVILLEDVLDAEIVDEDDPVAAHAETYDD